MVKFNQSVQAQVNDKPFGFVNISIVSADGEVKQLGGIPLYDNRYTHQIIKAGLEAGMDINDMNISLSFNESKDASEVTAEDALSFFKPQAV